MNTWILVLGLGAQTNIGTTENLPKGDLSLHSESASRKSIFLELAGSAGLGSLNFEHHFFRKGVMELTWRAGISIAPIDRNNGTAIIFPLLINALVGPKSHKLEVGIGQGLTITTKGNPFALTTGVLGYRYQAEDQSFFYRLSYTPLISYLVDFQWQHWAGASIGYTFCGLEK